MNIAIIGAGGHCKVIIDIAELLSYNIVGIYDDFKTGEFCNYKILGTINKVDETYNYVIGIGNDTVRQQIYNNNTKLKFITLIHPQSIISKTATIGDGTVVCAGSIIQPYVNIGKCCIINTNCNIDHESIIGDFSSICPSATICGNVKIGNKCFIGANSVIIQNKTIGDNCVVGAGSVIIKDFGNSLKIVGNLGRII